MLSNYFTLFHAARTLDRHYARTVIAEVYSQEKNTLSILLYAPEPHTITVCCNARENYITARSGDVRMRKNSVDLFPALIDMRIESVHVSATDRIIYAKISGNRWLCFEMFASKANVLLCEEHGSVTDAFLNKKKIIGTVKNIQHSAQLVSAAEIVPPKDMFVAQMIGDLVDHLNPVQRLKKTTPKLGTVLAEEIIDKSKVKNKKLTRGDSEEIHRITIETVDQIILLPEVRPVLYFEERSPLCFSLIPLEHLSSYRNEICDDLFSGIRKFISFERSTSTYMQKKKEIASWLTDNLEKSERTVRAVEKDLEESSRAEKYELFANLILTNLSTIPKGSRTAELEDTLSGEGTVTIPLDASLSPAKNAEKFFEKAKQSKAGREESRERLIVLRRRIVLLSDTLEKINRVTEGISLKIFLQSNEGTVKELGFMTEKEQEELPPFKIFVVDGGFTVYAGKNSANNDLLTFRYAKPNDLWFHARGSSGSHVVLKLGSAHGTPTKKAIEQAASVAAYYSKMKNAKHVPVAMTERKYIHKPKGSPAGTVALDKEKVIFVQPILPELKT